MEKDFNTWNKVKKKTNSTENEVIFYEREIWWTKIGLNVGMEIDGNHELFLRPVIIARKFNKYMALVIPVTRQDKSNKYYFDIKGVDEKVYKACLSHIKTISSKRLLRKIDMVDKDEYLELLKKVCQMIQGTL